MLPAGFEPAVPASERLQTQALGRSATWIGVTFYISQLYLVGCLFVYMCSLFYLDGWLVGCLVGQLVGWLSDYSDTNCCQINGICS